MKARNVFAAVFGRSGTGAPRAMLALGALVALLALALLSAASAAAVQRHYERVSPADKGGGDIVAEGLAITAAADGNGAAFDSRMGFANTVGSGNVGRTTYLATRGPDGTWSTRSITPMPRPDALQVLPAATKVQVFSEDLSTALVWAYDLPSVSDDAPDLENLYVQDNASGALRTISATQAEPLQLFDFLNPQVWGVSADAKHVAFATATQMLPDGTAPGYPNFAKNVYQWDDGVLTLAGILPDGTVPPSGSRVEQEGNLFGEIRGTMSADGSRQTFVSGGQLYLRIDGTRTALVSESENEGVTAGDVYFEGMTPDGNNVFFVTESPLLEADTADGPDLYRWTDGPDPADESNLTLITNTGSATHETGGYGASLVGMSDDGSRVYVHELAGRLTLWDDGVTKVADGSVTRTGAPKEHLALTATQPGNGRVSPDGNWVAYIKDDASNELFNQLYLYDRSAQATACVSCPYEASLVPKITNSGPLFNVAFRPRFLSDDGQVFFTTTGALVPEDTNGVADVYEYDGPSETLSLISSGKGSEPSEFADASRSGDDVFIVTRQRLVASDRDEYADLYDVRVGPPPPDQPPAPTPCQGDACQGALAGAPAAPQLGTALAGAGNNRQGRGPKRCAKNRRKVTRHGKTRCVKKHHSRTAKNNRRTSR